MEKLIHCEQINSTRIDAIQLHLDSLQAIKQDIQGLTKKNLDMAEKLLKESIAAFKKIDREHTILKSLSFKTMHNRYEAIPEAHKKTFSWIFKPCALPASHPRSKIALKRWFESETGIYWVSGKPGSGKSTFMKYISAHPQTEACLCTWAGEKRLVTAAFYFWIGGSRMQRSQKGLLQQLLFQILGVSSYVALYLS